MNKKQQLKELTTESTIIRNQVMELNKQQTTLQTKIGALQKQIEIEERSIPDIVSAHAIVRYLERTVGLDVDGLKRQIIADHEDHIKTFMTCRITTDNGVLVVKDGIVVTIL